MGLKLTSDTFCTKSDKAIHNISQAQKIVDAILLRAPDTTMLLERIRQVLDNCCQLKLTISRKKLEIGTKIDFAGYTNIWQT